MIGNKGVKRLMKEQYKTNMKLVLLRINAERGKDADQVHG